MIFGTAYVVFKKLISLISAIMLMVVGADEKNLPLPDGAEIIAKNTYVLFDYQVTSQGVTNDGEYFYFSGNKHLGKADMETGEIFLINTNAIPEALQEKAVTISAVGVIITDIFMPLSRTAPITSIHLSFFTMLKHVSFRALITHFLTNCISRACRGVLLMFSVIISTLPSGQMQPCSMFSLLTICPLLKQFLFLSRLTEYRARKCLTASFICPAMNWTAISIFTVLMLKAVMFRCHSQEMSAQRSKLKA